MSEPRTIGEFQRELIRLGFQQRLPPKKAPIAEYRRLWLEATSARPNLTPAKRSGSPAVAAGQRRASGSSSPSPRQSQPPPPAPAARPMQTAPANMPLSAQAYAPAPPAFSHPPRPPVNPRPVAAPSVARPPPPPRTSPARARARPASSPARVGRSQPAAAVPPAAPPALPAAGLHPLDAAVVNAAQSFGTAALRVLRAHGRALLACSAAVGIGALLIDLGDEDTRSDGGDGGDGVLLHAVGSSLGEASRSAAVALFRGLVLLGMGMVRFILRLLYDILATGCSVVADLVGLSDGLRAGEMALTTTLHVSRRALNTTFERASAGAEGVSLWMDETGASLSALPAVVYRQLLQWLWVHRSLVTAVITRGSHIHPIRALTACPLLALS